MNVRVSLRLVFALAAVLVGAAVRAEPPPAPVFTNGPEIFQAMLKVHGAEPVTRDEYESPAYDLRNTILVVWGVPQILTERMVDWQDATRRVLKAGGAVLIASHDSMSLEILMSPGLSPWINESKRTDDTISILRTEPDLPAPFHELIAATAADRKSVSKLGSPLPGLLRVPQRVSPFQMPLAYLVRNASSFSRALPVAAGGVGPESHPYRFLLYADQGILSNGMLLNKEFDNWFFSLNTVRFLQGPQKRSRCLFLDHGEVVENFRLNFKTMDLPDMPLPMPDWRRLQTVVADAVNQMVDRVETRDELNRSVMGRTESRQEQRLADRLAALAMIAAVMAVIFLVRRAWRSRQPHDPVLHSRVPLPRMNTVLGRRGEELLRNNNLIDLARTEARDLFRDLGASPHAGPQLPTIEYPQGWSADLERRIASLWRLSNDARRTTMTAGGWQSFESTLDTVRQAAAAGLWRFAHAGSHGA